MAFVQDDVPEHIKCAPTLEDEFALAQIHNELDKSDDCEEREQYLLRVIVSYICALRGYKEILRECDINADVIVEFP